MGLDGNGFAQRFQAAGVQPAWLAGEGVAIHDLRTPYGRLGYTLKASGRKVVLTLTQPIDPPGGLILSLPSGEIRMPKGQRSLTAPL